MTTSDNGIGEDRQRVDRWIEETQYLVGRLIPAMLDDRERLRAKSDVTEAERDRLRQEIGDLRREVGELQAERQFLRGEQAAITDALARALEHFAQAQQPLGEIVQRLQLPVAPVGS